MITITCDVCKEEVGIMGKVTLRGVDGSGDILQEQFGSRDFCCPACFWEWTVLNKPKIPVKEKESE